MNPPLSGRYADLGQYPPHDAGYYRQPPHGSAHPPGGQMADRTPSEYRGPSSGEGFPANEGRPPSETRPASENRPPAQVFPASGSCSPPHMHIDQPLVATASASCSALEESCEFQAKAEAVQWKKDVIEFRHKFLAGGKPPSQMRASPRARPRARCEASVMFAPIVVKPVVVVVRNLRRCSTDRGSKPASVNGTVL